MVNFLLLWWLPEETKLLEAAVNGEKSNGGERAALLTSGRVLMEGGVPIIDPAHGKIIGACGVSGVKPQEDAEVAKAAVSNLFPQAKLWEPVQNLRWHDNFRNDGFPLQMETPPWNL